MIEAFEIGVSLALRDGVSEGIAAARRDMVLVESAIRGAGVSFHDLQRAGSRALDTARYASAQGRDVDRVSPDTRRAVDAGKQRDDGVALPTTHGFAWDDLTSAPTPAVGAVWPAMQVGDSLHGPERVHPAPAAPAGPAGPLRMLEATGAAALQRLPPVAAPAAMTLRGDVESAPTRGEAGYVRDNGAWQGIAPGGAAPPTPPAMRMPAAPVNIHIDGPAPRAPLARQLALPKGAAVAPVGPRAFSADTGFAGYAATYSPDQGVATATPDRSATPAAQPLSPDKASASAETALHGDVFLDGVLVGRWMSRFLAKQAGRATAGPTGFDPRRNPVLPGPTIGF